MLKRNGEKRTYKNRYFMRMTLMYSFLLTAGILATLLFMGRIYINDLSDTQLKYENEVLSKIASHTDRQYIAIKDTFKSLYINNYYSIATELISPYSSHSKLVNRNDKQTRIMNTIQNVTLTNDSIVDFIIMDRRDETVYLYSNQRGRDISLDYNFFDTKDSLFHLAGNDIQILSNHIPEYIVQRSPSAKMEVITIYVNMYDLDYVDDDKRIGVMAVNLNPDKLVEPYLDELGEISGEVLITFNEDILYTTNKEIKDLSIVKKHPSNIMINQITSKHNNIVFTNIIDKKEISDNIRKETFPILRIMLVIILASVLSGYVISRGFYRRIRNLVQAVEDFELGRKQREIKVGRVDEIGYLESSFSDMFKRLDEYIENVYLADLKAKTAEIQVLQSQINPHYIFNTLESIRMVAMINQDVKASEMISILGTLFRWNMEMKKSHVTVEEELEFVMSYVELQKMRYDERFSFTAQCEDSLKSQQMPKLILQPIIENALYHGGTDEAKKLHISLHCSCDEELVFIVQDDGVGMPKETLLHLQKGLRKDKVQSNLYSIGLRNVHQRIRLLYGEEYGLSITSEEGIGTKVKIILPKDIILEEENA